MIKENNIENLNKNDLLEISGGNREFWGTIGGGAVSIGVRAGASRFIISNSVRTGAAIGGSFGGFGGFGGMIVGGLIGAGAGYLGSKYL